MRRLDGQTLLLSTVIIVVVGAFAVRGLFYDANGQGGSSRRREASLADSPVNAQRSYGYLKQICQLGPRISGSQGMARQQKMLTDHFKQLGGQVRMQNFDVRHPLDGSRVTMGNLIVQWHPDRVERILLCAHYDTRPFPDQDPVNKRGVFLGANDGASGVAVLMELGRLMPDLKGNYGVDFVFFDGEELVYDSDRDPYFLGSTHFARAYVGEPPPYRYRYGVLLDMVGDKDLQIYMEKNSLRFDRDLVRSIWGTAEKLGIREFIPRSRHEIRDDHLPLNKIAKIPTCDIIDFDYPSPRSRRKYWHTTDDRQENCSGESLAKVGWVVYEWLRRVE